MAKKSPTQRLARLEGICIGAGFLLKKLQARYGDDFSVGMTEQVKQCIRECDQVGKASLQREAASTSGVTEPFGGRSAWPEGAAFVDEEGRFYDEQAQPLGVQGTFNDQGENHG